MNSVILSQVRVEIKVDMDTRNVIQQEGIMAITREAVGMDLTQTITNSTILKIGLQLLVITIKVITRHQTLQLTTLNQVQVIKIEAGGPTFVPYPLLHTLILLNLNLSSLEISKLLLLFLLNDTMETMILPLEDCLQKIEVRRKEKVSVKEGQTTISILRIRIQVSILFLIILTVIVLAPPTSTLPTILIPIILIRIHQLLSITKLHPLTILVPIRFLALPDLEPINPHLQSL